MDPATAFSNSVRSSTSAPVPRSKEKVAYYKFAFQPNRSKLSLVLIAMFAARVSAAAARRSATFARPAYSRAFSNTSPLGDQYDVVVVGKWSGEKVRWTAFLCMYIKLNRRLSMPCKVVVPVVTSLQLRHLRWA